MEALGNLTGAWKEAGAPTEWLSSPVVKEFAVPLICCWGVLLAIDVVLSGIVSTFFSKRALKKKSAEGNKGKASSNDNGASVASQYKRSDRSFLWGNGPIPMNDTFALVVGAIMLAFLVPTVGVVVGLTVLWDFIDRAGMGRPQDGLVMTLAALLNRVTAPLTGRFTRKYEDGFLVNVVWFLGGVIPFLLFWNLSYTMQHGFHPLLCLAYHIFRIGPYFMNFAYCYVMCHKEGHTRVGLFKPGLTGTALRSVFNWWIGLFYGVLPSSFAYGHSINHHKYNNGPLDVVSTSDKPRDNFGNFVRFLPRWLMYATNISTIRQFLYEQEYKIAWKMVLGTAYYMIWVACLYRLSPTFTFWYVLFPAGENILLLACIQWCWHGFVDHENPENPFVGSITLLDGPINVLGEDFHTVHHQYPGAHWTQHEEKYKKHANGYKQSSASAFQNTHAFEMFFLIILREYKQMAEKFVDMSGKYPTHEDKEKLIRQRLQTCWWGPNACKDYQQHGWEGVEDSNGFDDQNN
mmetsp:Transcript_18147/g.51191  ORF Transcript_18147/g.51191 Transcript_18147/m.51191 type:complete len:518 (-) Transcript_18147:499-2052(-)|eukprot:CAMPEP_0119120794 /NCGR_PEP_ID=MMETSP1310-20130426/1694_1 /TAXON_ID=464262 /ORGANISM="Genus nov. species nov., Strain RCC2339" /LENGTH=517 /DNA_ID=CAMNT_0007110299 /DNA_START=97 /DNA_END=1650 /DNA_ORIENTATION=-